MELLWTDKCFLAVIFVAALIIGFGLRREPTRMAFRRVIRRPLAVGAGVVLIFFLAIAVMDSIHIPFVATDKAGAAVPIGRGSLLDRVLFPLGHHLEKTYSAPMALHSFTSVTDIANGEVRQIYPRLTYPDDRLFAKGARQDFIWNCLWQALWQALLIIVLCYAMVALVYYRKTAAHSLSNSRGLTTGSTAEQLQSGALSKGGQVHQNKSKLYRPVSAAGFSGWISFGCIVFLMLLLYKLSRELHVFGTGKIGEDVLYYTVKSIRTGLVIGLLTTLIMLPLALILGIAAGYFGGIVDDVIQYIYTTLSSIPGVLLITASILSMQTFIANHPDYFPTLASSADARLFALCLILGVTSWTSLCRLLRAEVLKLREIDYVQAAIALGSGAKRIILRHLLPNVMHIVLITLVLDFSFLVLAEAVLSYVGVGVSPMTISWGNMINGARLELAREPLVWWPMLAAFVFMFALVLSGNLFADAVRDAFDPHHDAH